ncbi:COX15/CtaA family protein [Agromyces seonyuensis]|uniref:COX15/CtaA family protein n=1 Tax=Agromyces seonyuensis TaxID=2662446 RepID=UPI0030148886
MTSSPAPARIPTALRVFAWLSFVAQTTIIATGGAVRLTASGLGCPTWPLCTAESLVPTEELSYHSLIEFGNRLMTGVVGIVALAVFLLVIRYNRRAGAKRQDLFTLSFVVGLGIVAQAIVGGITVWTGLNPFIVGFHYLSSLALVCVTAVFLFRLDQPSGPRVPAAPKWFAILTHVTTLALAISLVFGVLTTGAGPHSGDSAAGRNGFDAVLLQHIHAWPGYVLFALTLVLVVAAFRLALPARRWFLALLLLELVQIAVGLWQARHGLPPLLVGIHMVLAALLSATMTLSVLSLKQPAASSVDAEPEAARTV